MSLQQLQDQFNNLTTEQRIACGCVGAIATGLGVWYLFGSKRVVDMDKETMLKALGEVKGSVKTSFDTCLEKTKNMKNPDERGQHCMELFQNVQLAAEEKVFLKYGLSTSEAGALLDDKFKEDKEVVAADEAAQKAIREGAQGMMARLGMGMGGMGGRGGRGGGASAGPGSGMRPKAAPRPVPLEKFLAVFEANRMQYFQLRIEAYTAVKAAAEAKGEPTTGEEFNKQLAAELKKVAGQGQTKLFAQNGVTWQEMRYSQRVHSKHPQYQALAKKLEVASKKLYQAAGVPVPVRVA